MNDKTKKVLIGLATTALIGVAAYYTCKLASNEKEFELGEPLPGTTKIEKLIVDKKTEK